MGKTYRIPPGFKNKGEYDEYIRMKEGKRKGGEARWKGKTKEERSAHAKMMAEAKKKLSTGKEFDNNN